MITGIFSIFMKVEGYFRRDKEVGDVSNTNIEMVLWAWLRDRLQLYTRPAFLLRILPLADAEESQAFFHLKRV